MPDYLFRLAELRGNAALEPVTALYPWKGALKSVILFDLSWCIYRGHYALPSLTATVDGVEIPTGSIAGTLRDIIAWSEVEPHAAVILCVDWGTFRQQISADYKAHRAGASGVKDQVTDLLQVACIAPHVFLAAQESYEADDHVFNLSQAFSSIGLEVVVFGSDRDLYQSLTNDRVSMAKTTRSDAPRVRSADVVAEWGVPPDRAAMYRAFSGDSSDNLKGYKRFPTKFAAVLANLFPSPKEFLGSTEEQVFEAVEESGEKLTGAKKKWIKLVRENPATLVSNYGIMKLGRLDALYLYKALPEPNLVEALELRGWGEWCLRHGIDYRRGL